MSYPTTPRPRRRMPGVMKIATYWERRDVTDQSPFFVDLGEPSCFGCRAMAPEWDNSYFDRAHLVDRCRGGLDLEPNLVLLCGPCHYYMPSFGPDDAADAIEWVRAGGILPIVIDRGRAMGITRDSPPEEFITTVNAVVREMEDRCGRYRRTDDSVPEREPLRKTA